MKKLLFVAVASLGLSAMAAHTPTQVGVTKITATSENTLVPVQFKSLSTGEDIAAGDLVKTANLKAGTWLYMFNGSSYTAWTLLTDGGAWTAADTSTKDGVQVGVPAGTETLSAGSAVWIVLPSAETYNQDIYVYGAYLADVTASITKGSAALIANPLQASATPTITNPAKGDTLTLISTGKTYTFNGTAWGSLEKKTSGLPQFTEWTTPSIAVGSGFWYRSKGTESNVSISWAASAP